MTSCFSRTQHITAKPTTIVLVYKNIPFFQHKVYTFFYWGGILSVVLQNNNHFTPKEGFPKPAHLMALKSSQLRGFFCVCVCEKPSTRTHSQDYHTKCTIVTIWPFFFSLDLFFFSQNTQIFQKRFKKRKKYKKKEEKNTNKEVPNLKPCSRKVL